MTNNTVLGVLDNKCVVPIEPFYTYTHTKSGTAHALVGNFGGNIKFIATADYIAGDTFTVNNTPVTAKLQNGGELGNNSFISGSVVTCFLNETTLYFGAIGAIGSADNDATLLATGLNDSSGVYLTESAYNFRFLVFEVDVGRNILVPMFDNQTAVFGSLSEFTAEAYDTYMFGAAVSSGGTILGDNRNAKVTTRLGNPAQTTYNTFTVNKIYGLCRRA